MADDNERIPSKEYPTDYILRKTRPRFPWRILAVVVAVCGIAGALLWHLLGG